ncbi:MAG: hypothetical protein M1831_002904 [Alyxoria varia]|nr:MAG: hypothetical protein M1831_002904 [Alyxoria varia]
MAYVLNRVQDVSSATRDRAVMLIDSQIPPSKRSEWSNSFKSWMSQNPKLGAFVMCHAAFSLPPTLLFLGFTLMTLMTSVLVCLVTALTIALSFTAFCAGLALLVLLPTLLVSTILATFVFIGGFVFYSIVHRFTNDPRTEGVRTKSKETVLNFSEKANGVVDTYVDPVDGKYGSSDMNRNVQSSSKASDENLPGVPATTAPGIMNYGIHADSRNRDPGPKDHASTNGGEWKKRDFEPKDLPGADRAQMKRRDHDSKDTHNTTSGSVLVEGDPAVGSSQVRRSGNPKSNLSATPKVGEVH